MTSCTPSTLCHATHASPLQTWRTCHWHLTRVTVLSYVRQTIIFPPTTTTTTPTAIIIRITTTSGLALMGSDYPQFLLEAARVLKIGGRFISLHCILTSISHPPVLLAF